MKKTRLLPVILLIAFTPGCEETADTGTNTMIEILDEPAGENCANGGTKVITGIDLDDNGTLEENEIQNTAYICNGVDGANTMLDILDEPAGEHCTNGGFKVVTGIDDNDNGILDENEIDQAEYICNGADGSNTMLDIVPEPAGENCEAGGYKVMTGIDLNGNDTLDEDEIENTEYICNGMDGAIGPGPKLLVAIKENEQLISEYKYDSLNRLIQFNGYHDETISYSESYQYDAGDKLIGRSYLGFVETYLYSEDGRIEKVITKYPATNKEWSIVYQYDAEKINKGIVYYNDTQTGYIEYKYDSNGNTIERTEYSIQEGTEGWIMSQYRMTYDNKILPVKDLGRFPFDIVQKNNPTYYYYENAAMSAPPPEYSSTYKYNIEGYPVKEYRGTRIFDYEYVFIVDR